MGGPSSNATWIEEETLVGHTDWVRDVAWAPNVGLPRSYIASCGQDRCVFVWTRDGEGKKWERVALNAGGLEGNANTEGMHPFLSRDLGSLIICVSQVANFPPSSGAYHGR